MIRNTISFTLNGELIELSGKDAFLPFSDILRYQYQRTGTKVVCAEGDCGACTVLISESTKDVKDIKFKSINSCILTTFLIDGKHIITIEGIKNNNQLCEIQDSMVRNFGAQCGFCTPGFIMSIANIFENKEKPTEQNIKNYLTGNLCRCTGYKQIIDAINDIDPNKIIPLKDKYNFSQTNSELFSKTNSELKLFHGDKLIYAPDTIDKAILFKKEHPKLRIFSGATDIGVQINKGRKVENTKMSLHLIKDLYDISLEDNNLSVGAKVTIEEFQNFIEDKIVDFSNFLNIFASPQIKNSATLVGNLANGSPIADTSSSLFALDASVILHGEKGERTVPVTSFFKGYKSFDMKVDELITKIIIPLPKKNSKLGIYKVSQRRDLDISTINACFNFEVENNKIVTSKVAYGGVAATPVRLNKIEQFLNGKVINKKLIKETIDQIKDNINPISDIRGTKSYRVRLAQRLFEKYIHENFSLDEVKL